MPPDALLDAAAAGRLPDWAEVGPARIEHCGRVAALMGEWASRLELADADIARWKAAGWLHDALKDAPADVLRRTVPERQRDLPEKLLHGPAVAARLRRDGIADEPLLDAIASHTTGSAGLESIGHALYIADFIEPERRYVPDTLAALRARMPESMNDVLRDVVLMKLDRLTRDGKPVRAETVEMWNEIAGAGAH